jgi:integrase
MASIGSESNGRKRILFLAGDGSRKTVRLGNATAKQAEAFKVKVESLISANITNSMDDETSRWLAGLNDTMHARLAACGLVKARTGERAALGVFIDAYIAGRPTLKPATIIGLKQVRRYLVNHFGERRDMQTMTPDDAENFRAGLIGLKLGDNTIRRTIGRSRQFFKAAIRRGLVRAANPFDGMAASTRSNKSRQAFIDRQTIDKVIAKCPDAQWRLLVVLARYGGVRMPSEALGLKWADVLWDQNKIRVPQPKLEHVGKGERIIPMFPELRGPLLEVFEEAEPGTEFVITRYRDRASNLRTHFNRIIGRAGLTPWPKLWHNLRASRQTELAETFPMHVVCQWIGNTGAVAMEHYLQTLDSHFTRAVGDPAGRGDAMSNSAAQNPAQYPAVTQGIDKQLAGTNMQNPREIRGNSASCDTVHNDKWPLSESNRYALAGGGF